MSRQFELNALLSIAASKKPHRLSCADVQIKLKRGALVGQFSITKVGRPKNPKATNSPVQVRTTNASVQKQRSQGGGVKEKHMKVKTPKINWTTPDNFRLPKAPVEVSLCVDKCQRNMLTDRSVPDHTLIIIVPTFSGILKKDVKFEGITVGMVYSTQARDCSLLSLSYRGFLEDIIIYRYNANDGMRRLEVISIIG